MTLAGLCVLFAAADDLPLVQRQQGHVKARLLQGVKALVGFALIRWLLDRDLLGPEPRAPGSPGSPGP